MTQASRKARLFLYGPNDVMERHRIGHIAGVRSFRMSIHQMMGATATVYRENPGIRARFSDYRTAVLCQHPLNCRAGQGPDLRS
jgi:hypothetical protein